MDPPTLEQNNLKKPICCRLLWCVEAIFESVEGVHEVYSGYAGNYKKSKLQPNCTGRTGHAEAVEVHYDPKVVSFGTLLQVFFGSHDPTLQTVKGLIEVHNIDQSPFMKMTKNRK